MKALSSAPEFLMQAREGRVAHEGDRDEFNLSPSRGEPTRMHSRR